MGTKRKRRRISTFDRVACNIERELKTCGKLNGGEQASFTTGYYCGWYAARRYYGRLRQMPAGWKE